jgi:hypothetical protein
MVYFCIKFIEWTLTCINGNVFFFLKKIEKNCMILYTFSIIKKFKQCNKFNIFTKEESKAHL